MCPPKYIGCYKAHKGVHDSPPTLREQYWDVGFILR